MANHEIIIPSQVFGTDGAKREEWSQKTGISPQVKTANIPGFQNLGIVSLERVLPDDLKTYIYWQTTISPHHHKY